MKGPAAGESNRTPARACAGCAVEGGPRQCAAAASFAPVGLAIAFLLSGCAVGPDFKSPEAPGATSSGTYTPAPVAQVTASAPGLGGAAQHLALGQDIPAQWWSLFHSESLDRLIRAALAHNPSLAAAQAALREARENFNAQSGSLLYPSVTGQLAADRQRSSSSGGATTPGAGGRGVNGTGGATATGAGNGSANISGGGPITYNLFNTSVNVSYALDVFGANRRTLEGLAAAIDYQRYQVEAAYLTLVSNVVTTAILEASLRAQLEATREVLELQTRQVGVVEAQFNAGAVSRAPVLLQQAQAAQTRATVAPLEKALAQARHQLSVYAGELPSEQDLPEFSLDSLQLPQELPVTLPSSLVRQRPDIRASEALLHEASAQIGVATANLYPQINLTASLGSGALQLGDLFSPSTIVWTAAAALAQPIFNGGALNAKKRAAEAAYEQARAQYQSTVLGAFQNVADALRAIESDATALGAQADAAKVARESLDLSTQQYQLGAISFLALLDAQRTYQQTKISLAQAQAARFADTAALFQALGGGWWNRTAQ
ncbi:MAG: efflux transporter outer membrane subunit [Pseudomonadota bacterium]|nr:efflux transporter outer membrane subunit [Pseudomonadota bacterium]